LENIEMKIQQTLNIYRNNRKIEINPSTTALTLFCLLDFDTVQMLH